MREPPPYVRRWLSSFLQPATTVYAVMTGPPSGRLGVVDEVLADPPIVHYLTYDDLLAGTLTGVHGTDASCYRFLAGSCESGSRTLETGAGISTVLFAAWGTRHRCVTPRQEEAEAITAYCRSHGIPIDGVTFDISPSAEALVPSPKEPLDLVFIDGNHGFPHPILDWYFAAGGLRRGGRVVLDDVQLPAVKVLQHFVDQDPRWSAVERTAKWAAYERTDEWSLLEDWYMQPFYHLPGLRLAGRLPAGLRRALQPLKRLVMS